MPASGSGWTMTAESPVGASAAGTTRSRTEKSRPETPSAIRCPRRPGRPAPAGGGLREQPGGDGGVEGGVAGRARVRMARSGRVFAKVGAPVDDLGLPAVEADHQAGAGGTEVQGVHRESLSVVRSVRCWCAGFRLRRSARTADAAAWRGSCGYADGLLEEGVDLVVGFGQGAGGLLAGRGRRPWPAS